MAHKKGQGSSRNGRDSNSKRLGVKLSVGGPGVASVTVTGPPRSIWLRKIGTTLPEEASTLPNRTVMNRVVVCFRRAASTTQSTRRRPSSGWRCLARLERMRVPLVDQIASHPRTVLALAALVTVVSLWGLRWVQFDYNLLNLQADGTESVEWERKILATAHRSGFAALSSARSLEELRAKHAAFGKLPSVSEVDSALLLIPEDQEAKRRIIQDLAPVVETVRIGRPLGVSRP